MKREKFINNKIKSILIRILLSIIKGFKFIIKSFFNLLKPLAIPLKWLALFFYKIIIINLYKFFYYLRKIKNIIFPSEKIKILYLFVNKYITHLIIIILVIIVCFTNFFTNQTRAESFGEKSILFALATGSDLESEYIEETLQDNQPKITSYLETQGTAVSGNTSALSEEELSQEEMNALISGEGSALLKPEFTTMEASKAQRDRPIDYIVKENDTLGTIAQNFSISVETILWENNLTMRSLIRPGQKLVILPTSGISYKVAKGDSLTKIAQRYKIDKQKIIEFNKLADESDIQVGLYLVIPEGQPYYAPQPVIPKLAALSKIINPTHVDVPAGEKMAWPTTAHRISQYFSWRHIGLDIDGDFGDPVWAADDGVVITSICMKTGYGCHVIIDHGGGKTTLYGHFQKIYVKQGQRVARGDVLGEEGSTGHSTGSHLHFEVRFGGKRYNPLSYIR